MFIFTATPASKTVTREVIGWGADRQVALQNALKSAELQVSGEEAFLISYHITSESAPQLQYNVSLIIDFGAKLLTNINGWGENRELAINNGLTSAVAQSFSTVVVMVMISMRSLTSYAELLKRL